MSNHPTSMRVAITGGTGFVGGHLAMRLSGLGHEVVLVARGVDRRPLAREVLRLPSATLVGAGVDDQEGLARAFAGCQAVAHCAGINRELGRQTYEAVHVRGTANVVRAAERAGVRRLALVSFLRARPGCGSAYHESKWAAEEVVRASSLDWTVPGAGPAPRRPGAVHPVRRALGPGRPARPRPLRPGRPALLEASAARPELSQPTPGA